MKAVPIKPLDLGDQPLNMQAGFTGTKITRDLLRRAVLDETTILPDHLRDAR